MLRTLKFVLNHPLNKGKAVSSLFNVFKWQVFSRIYKFPVVYPFTQNSKLLVWSGLAGATGNVYCGLHEFEDMAFLLHLLRADDLFVDIGANIGSYTILSSAEIGAGTISIEPIPETYNYLLQNIAINNVSQKVKALNIGLGSEKNILKFTNEFDTGNHVASADTLNYVSVNVDTLDSILGEKRPVLLKIDVEGFEAEVIKGAVNTLQNASLKAIIIELNGSGNRYGYNDHDIHLKLLESGFKAMAYLPFERRLIETPPNNEHNTLYIRDLDFVQQRIKNSRKVLVKNNSL
jgi:FkbM family methyltransferase